MPQSNALIDSLNRSLCAAYHKGVGVPPRQSLSNQRVLETFGEQLPCDTSERMAAFLANKRYLFQKVKAQRGRRTFFQQPAILLAYFLADTMPVTTRDHWPLDEDDLAQVFSDLGIAF